jgi:hypothetical protein
MDKIGLILKIQLYQDFVDGFDSFEKKLWEEIKAVIVEDFLDKAVEDVGVEDEEAKIEDDEAEEVKAEEVEAGLEED